MRHHKLNYAFVGLFVLSMMGAAVSSVFVLSDPNRETDPYFLVMNNVADVKFGTQVRFEGYSVGQVESVDPFEDNGRMRFRLSVSILRGWPVPSDSVARVGSSSLLAAKTIDIASGTSTTPLAVGDRIISGTARDVFAAVAGLAEEFGALNRETVRPLIDDLGALAKRLGGKLETDIVALTTKLNSIASAIDGRTGPILDRVDSSTRNLARILSEGNVETIGHIVANLDDASRNVANVSRGLDATALQVDAVIAELKRIVDENGENVNKTITNAQYTLQAVARNIDAILQNVDSTGRNMSEFSRLIRQNPSLLLGGAVREEVLPASNGFRGVRQ